MTYNVFSGTLNPTHSLINQGLQANAKHFDECRIFPGESFEECSLIVLSKSTNRKLREREMT